jgi:hypothetical protein
MATSSPPAGENAKTPTVAQMRTGHVGIRPWDVLRYKQALKEYERAPDGA